MLISCSVFEALGVEVTGDVVVAAVDELPVVVVVAAATVAAVPEEADEDSIGSGANGSRSGSAWTGRLFGAGVTLGVGVAFGLTTTW